MLPALLAAAALLSLSPQAPPKREAAPAALPGFHLVASTARVDYFAMDDSRVPGNAALKVEQLLETIERRMEQRGPRRLSYYRVTHVMDVERLTGCNCEGATDLEGTRIVSSRDAHAHELVHAVALGLGNPGRFFQEGLAVALAAEPGWSGRRLERGARSGLDRLPLPRYWSDFERAGDAEGYAVAGGFVAYLIQAHGLDKVLEFFRGCGNCPRDEVFVRTFGVTMAEAGTTWKAQLYN